MVNLRTTKKWQASKRDFVFCIDVDLCFIRVSIGWQNKGFCALEMSEGRSFSK